jgi:hypothetical protein
MKGAASCIRHEEDKKRIEILNIENNVIFSTYECIWEGNISRLKKK